MPSSASPQGAVKTTSPRLQSSAAKWLRLPTVEDRTGQKKSKIYAMIAQGRFPAPAKIDGVSVWRASEIDAWEPGQSVYKTPRDA